MAIFELKIITHFAAAHQLQMVAKKCEELHGHNWKVEVCVKGDRLNNAGVLIDFSALKKYVSEIIERLDHKFLNELDCLACKNPSSENIAMYIAKELQKVLDNSNIKVSSITTWESDDACAIYRC